ncbi:hypothetical protein TNCV_1132471 [Trichonephila clavipes]|nr:hypothetical protein TNCV_1132471 [Trichonephila clavipes]
MLGPFQFVVEDAADVRRNIIMLQKRASISKARSKRIQIIFHHQSSRMCVLMIPELAVGIQVAPKNSFTGDSQETKVKFDVTEWAVTQP